MAELRVGDLACPSCRGALAPAGEEIACAAGHRFPVRDGIPRFVAVDDYAASFGFQWNLLGALQLDSKNGTGFSERRFREITGWGEAELRGRRVLDAGCGAGRFAEIVKGKYGADLFALDLSAAVDACRANLMPDPPVVCQASIYEPPFPDASFDYVYCIGVIQHTPDPDRTIRSLCRMVKPGGRIGLWIYESDWKSYVGTLGFRRLLRPLVSRWPRARQLAFSEALASAFVPLVWPLRRLGWPGRAAARMTPVASAHIFDVPLARDDFRKWVVLDTFDMYASAYDQPQTFPHVAALLREEGFLDVQRQPVGAIAVTGRLARLMCGIAGALGAWPAEALPRMVAAVRHRGPDDEGEEVRESGPSRVGLGCARLAIIDLSPQGHMPMRDEDTGNAVAYNGEVYNFQALREELSREGARFVSSTDTEVLLKGYARWGAAVVPRLEGMFAFALHDARKGEVLLARDRLGEKPLYYFPGPPFVFASEVRALLASGLVPRRLDAAAVESFLVNGFVVSPLTLLRGVRSLLPGHVLRVRADGVLLEERRYWRLPPPAAPRADASAGADAIRERLRDSVRKRLVSDVPLGAFLSGGLDSTAQVALMRCFGVDVRTFSVTFDEKEFDESLHSRRAASAYGTTHTELRLGRDRFSAWLPDAVAGFDQPSFDGLNTYYVSRAAREAGLTVALSGAGADELFGGYPFFRQVPPLARLARVAAGLPARARAAALAGMQRRPTAVAGAAKLMALLGEDASVTPARATVAAYQTVQSLFAPWAVDALVSPDARPPAGERPWFGLPAAFLARLDEELEGTQGREAVSRLALRLFLGERCLRDADTTSMAVSLELRAPFVDHLVMEAALAVPARARCRGVPDKPFERDLLRSVLGPAYEDRRKQGFVFPFERWLRDPASLERLRADLLAPGAADAVGLRAAGVATMLDAFAGGGSLPWSRLWALSMLFAWCARHGVTR